MMAQDWQKKNLTPEEEHDKAVLEFMEKLNHQFLRNVDQESASAVTRRFENSILMFLTSLELYATAYKARYGSNLGEDGFFGPLFEEMIRIFKELLNGETGRLDGYTTWVKIRNLAIQSGLNFPE
jgi:hypothetical protein